MKQPSDVANYLLSHFENPAYNSQEVVQRAISAMDTMVESTLYLPSIVPDSAKAKRLTEAFNREPGGYLLRLVFGQKAPKCPVTQADRNAYA